MKKRSTFQYNRVVFYRQGSVLYRERFLGRTLKASARKEGEDRWHACPPVPAELLVGWEKSERKTGLKVGL